MEGISKKKLQHICNINSKNIGKNRDFSGGKVAFSCKNSNKWVRGHFCHAGGREFEPR